MVCIYQCLIDKRNGKYKISYTYSMDREGYWIIVATDCTTNTFARAI